MPYETSSEIETLPQKALARHDTAPPQVPCDTTMPVPPGDGSPSPRAGMPENGCATAAPASAEWARRALDIAASLGGLIALAPLFAVVALLIRLEGGGPVFFLQERIGRGFRPFRICKFRTMVADAWRKGGFVTVDGDARITRLGRLLRKYKVDELPQLINVLKGDMSLVGPRPEMAMYVELFHSDYERLLQARPGITDPASLHYAQEERLLAQSNDPEAEYVSRILPDKLSLSLRYAQDRTFMSDLRVIMETLFKISVGRRRR